MIAARPDTRLDKRARGSINARQRLVMKHRLGVWVWALIRAVLILGICYIILAPLLAKMSSSLMTPRDVYDPTVRWIPRRPTIENFRVVWDAMQYPIAAFNSLKLALLVSLLQTASAAVIGYGFARFRFRGSGLLFGLVIFTLVVPPQTIIVPLYLNFRFFNLFGLIPDGGVSLLNSYWPFILMATTGAGLRSGLFIYIMRQYFRGMPRAIEDAAYVDGAGHFRTFFSVMLPSAVPSLVTIFLFSFVWQWNDSTLTGIYMGDSTLLTRTLGTVAPSLGAKAEYASIVNNTGMLMFIAPLLILYAIMQRYFVESVERTGIVG